MQIVDLRDKTNSAIRNQQMIMGIFDSLGKAEAMRQDRNRTTRILQAMASGGDVYQAALAEPQFNEGLSGFFQRLGAVSSGKFERPGLRESIAERGIRAAIPTPYERARLISAQARAEESKAKDIVQNQNAYMKTLSTLEELNKEQGFLDAESPEDVALFKNNKIKMGMLESQLEMLSGKSGVAQFMQETESEEAPVSKIEPADSGPGLFERIGNLFQKGTSPPAKAGPGVFGGFGAGTVGAPPSPARKPKQLAAVTGTDFDKIPIAKLPKAGKQRPTLSKHAIDVIEELKGYAEQADDETKAELQKILQSGKPEVIKKAFEILKAKYGTTR